jgi:hypothetical protein
VVLFSMYKKQNQMSVAYIKQLVPSGTTNNDIISPLQYSGTWYVNAATTLSGPDLTFTPSQMTLDTSVPNINATTLLNSSTSYFSIKAPVSGMYACIWTIRGTTGAMTTSGTFSTIVYTYIGAHVLNGNSISALGTQPGVNYRPGMEQMTYSTPSGNNTTYNFHQSTTPTIYLKAGDIVAPWLGGGYGNGAGSLDISTSANKFSITLIRQTT